MYGPFEVLCTICGKFTALMIIYKIDKDYDYAKKTIISQKLTCSSL